MKIVYLLVVVMASLTLNACSDDATSTENSDNGFFKMDFVLGKPGQRAASRSVTVSDPFFKFAKGDQFGVYCPTTVSSAGRPLAAANALITLTSGDGNFTDFEYFWKSNYRNQILVYYPYNTSSETSAPFVKGTMLSKQTQYAVANTSVMKCSNLLYRNYVDFVTFSKGRFYVEDLKPYFPVVQFTVVCNDAKYAGWTVEKATLKSSKPLPIGGYDVDLADLSSDVVWDKPTTATTFTVEREAGALWKLDTNAVVNFFMTVPVMADPTTLTLSVDIATPGGLTQNIELGLNSNPTLALKQGQTYTYVFSAGNPSAPAGGSSHESFTPNTDGGHAGFE